MPTTTKYIWDDENYLAEADGSDTINVVYTNEPQQYGNLVSTRISTTTSYHHFDAIGSTRQLTNAAGAVTDRATYDAWGNVVSRTGTTASRQLWIGELAYYFDTEINLNFVRARIFDPTVGRWTAVDPLPPQSAPLNPYLYAMNGLLASQDPSGAKRFCLYQCPCMPLQCCGPNAIQQCGGQQQPAQKPTPPELLCRNALTGKTYRIGDTDTGTTCNIASKSNCDCDPNTFLDIVVGGAADPKIVVYKKHIESCPRVRVQERVPICGILLVCIDVTWRCEDRGDGKAAWAPKPECGKPYTQLDTGCNTPCCRCISGKPPIA
jgi:RHS repeat-associated protein